MMIEAKPLNGGDYYYTDETGLGAAAVVPISTGTLVALALLGIASVAASAYHGYRRAGDDAGAGLAWGIFGLFFPVVTPLVALAQGYAKPAG